MNAAVKIFLHGRFALLLQFWPPIDPVNIALDKHRLTTRNTVAVTEEKIFVAKMIDGTMSGSLIVGLISPNDWHTATIEHVNSPFIYIRTFHRLATPYHDPVSALHPHATVIP